MKQKQFLECPVILSLSSRWHCCIKTTHQLRFRDWRKIFFSLSKNLPSSNGQTGKKWIMKRLFPSLVQYGWCSWENGFPYLNMCVFDHFIHGICWVWKVTPSFLPPSLPPSLALFLPHSLSMPKFNKHFWFEKREVRNVSWVRSWYVLGLLLLFSSACLCLE